MKQGLFFLILLFFSTLFAKELKIEQIFLEGSILNPKEEISGMDWYKEHLFLLPENQNHYLYVISKVEIYNSLNSSNKIKILPKKSNFIAPNYRESIEGFEGFESIAFHNDKFFITIEAKEKDIMKSYVIWGEIDAKSFTMKSKRENILELKTPVQVRNMTYESALIYKDIALFLFEANGKNLQKNVYQKVLSLKDFSVADIKFPNIEYRITDATKIDENNKFWAINYYWPGDKKHLNPVEDYLKTLPKSSNKIERIVEFKIKDNEVVFSESKPIEFSLDDENSRNWEGLVRLDNQGFLIATDKYPEMLLAFVEYKYLKMKDIYRNK